MRRVLIPLFSLAIIWSLFIPATVHGAVTDAEIKALRDEARTYSSYNGFDNGGVFLINYQEIVASTAARLKNDPDVNKEQLKKYILEGIPGATDPNQQGFIPYLQKKLSDCSDRGYLSAALNTVFGNSTAQCIKLTEAAIANAEIQLKGATVRDEKNGGVITQAEASTQIQNAGAEGSRKVAAAIARFENAKCQSLWDATFIDCIDVAVAWIIKHYFLQIAGFVLWLSANMMNYAIKIAILQFSQWAPAAFYGVWVVVRQVISLFVVFAGLWLGMMYILDRKQEFERFVPYLILFALFVNFSYPFARTLIDVSNVISLNIYTSVFGAEALSNDVMSSKSPGSIITNRLGLVNIVDLATGTKAADSGFLNSLDSVPGALTAVVFILYSAYVFFMATAILVTRTAVLVFVIIGSPLLFVDSVVPALGEQAKKLRGIFVDQLTVGPVFTILLAITLKFLDSLRQSGPLSSISTGINAASNATAGRQDTVQIFFGLLLMIVALHLMLKITKSVAGKAGAMATDFMGKVGGMASGVAVGAATGGVGLLGRATVGSLAAKARDSKWMTNNQDSFLGRRAYNLSNSLASSSFDARNSSVAKAGFNKLGLSRGMGSGQKGGYDADVTNKMNDRRARLGRIQVTNDDGTINKEGAAAKQRFYEKNKDLGGGKFGKEMVDKDWDEAIAANKKIDAYVSKTGEKKEAYFNAQTDPILKEQMKAVQVSKDQLAANQALAQSNQALATEMRETRNAKSGVGVAAAGAATATAATPIQVNVTDGKTTGLSLETPTEASYRVRGLSLETDKEASARVALDKTKSGTENRVDHNLVDHQKHVEEELFAS